MRYEIKSTVSTSTLTLTYKVSFFLRLWLLKSVCMKACDGVLTEGVQRRLRVFSPEGDTPVNYTDVTNQDAKMTEAEGSPRQPLEAESRTLVYRLKSTHQIDLQHILYCTVWRTRWSTLLYYSCTVKSIQNNPLWQDMRINDWIFSFVWNTSLFYDVSRLSSFTEWTKINFHLQDEVKCTVILCSVSLTSNGSE